MLLPYNRIHFVGVGGVGMVALAEVLLAAGHIVTGSDLKESTATKRLRCMGGTVHIGHSAPNAGGADLVVASSAVPAENPELQQARELGISIWKRADLLGALTRRQRSILVAGTHGKTSTSAMVALVLDTAGLSPTFLVGGDLRNLGTGARLGSGPYLVAEADEFDRSFLKMSPWAAIVTSVEADHLDYYGTLEAVQEAFRQFVASVPQDGLAVLCADCHEAIALGSQCKSKVVTYGMENKRGRQRPEWAATSVRPNQRGGNDFAVVHKGKRWGKVSLQVPGRHNICNALATIGVCTVAGAAPEAIREGLASFQGTGRRFELRGYYREAALYDDYAHHPTEVRATLAAARERKPVRLWAVFQPHTTHRLQSLFPEFVSAFDAADRVLIVDAYLPPGREQDPGALSSADLVAAMKHPDARHIPDMHDAAEYLANELRKGDLVLIMGAGDITSVTEELLSHQHSQGAVNG